MTLLNSNVSLRWFFLILFLVTAVFGADLQPVIATKIPTNLPLKYPINSPLEGPDSVYTKPLAQVLINWPPPGRVTPKPGEIRIQRLDTPGQRFYIGAEQSMLIQASLTAVEAIIDDISQFKEIFPDFADVKVTSLDGNRFTVGWEHEIPVFFLPNVKYETIYLVDKTKPHRKIYRYKLHAATTDMVSADGIIILEKESDKVTRFTEYDFWDAKYGIVEIFLPSRIWKDSLESIYVSDVALKLKAEHPDWLNRDVLKAAEKSLPSFPLEEVLANPKQLPGVFEPRAITNESH